MLIGSVRDRLDCGVVSGDWARRSSVMLLWTARACDRLLDADVTPTSSSVIALSG